MTPYWRGDPKRSNQCKREFIKFSNNPNKFQVLQTNKFTNFHSKYYVQHKQTNCPPVGLVLEIGFFQ